MPQPLSGAGSPAKVIDDGGAPPEPGRWSRRAFLAADGVTTGAVVLTTAGRSYSWLDPFNLFAPRKLGTGPQAVPVNRTAADAKVADLAGAKDWTLTVSHQDIRRSLSLAELRAPCVGAINSGMAPSRPARIVGSRLHR